MPTQTESVAATPKRITKRGWITLAASAGALLVAAAIAVPVISSNIARGNAIDALTASETQLTDAHTSLASVNAELDEAAAGALTVYTESGEFVKVVRADLLADAATLDELSTARAELADTAGLVIEGATVTGPEAAQTPDAPASSDPTTLEAMAEQTEANLQQAETYSQDAETARATADEIAEQQDAIGELTETVVSSGGEFGAAVTGMEKAEAATVDGLKTAVTALADTETPAIGRFSTYVAAYDAVKASHDAAVAAEQAAAEEAARSRLASRVAPPAVRPATCRAADRRAARAARRARPARAAAPRAVPTPADRVRVVRVRVVRARVAPARAATRTRT